MDRPIDYLRALRSVPDLAAAPRERKEAILNHWNELVWRELPNADDLTAKQVRDSIPVILDQMAAAIESALPEQTDRLADLSTQHGVTRLGQSYNIEELVIEYRLLRRVAVEELHAVMAHRLRAKDVLALDMGIDAALQSGVVAYVRRNADDLRSAANIEAKYLSFLSHDLRNNLNSAVLMMDVLRQRLERTGGFDDEAADLGDVKQAIMQTIEGMDRLLQAERAGRTAAHRNREAVDLARLTSDVTRTFERQAKDKGLSLVVAVPLGAVVRSDRELIVVVLNNLIGNAVKFTDRGTIRVEGERSSACEDVWALIVRDEGPGIAPEQLGRLYDAFSRGDTHGQPGVGLGLAIAAQSSRTLGATLSVESEVGRGTVFRLCLPP